MCENKYIVDLIHMLINNRKMYFSRFDVLNSEGKKILEIIIQNLLKENQEYRKIIYKIRRKPTFENILKLAEILNIDVGEYKYLTFNN
ncbi:MAG: hypothetical protein DRJ45_07525 [Thermoprotei archaeon]|nr:MAG: hypothetical protein DRJ45_07525 [Thermoprotei archaeon]